MYEIQNDVVKPERANSTFPFKEIPVGGALVVAPSEGEAFDKLTMRVRNAVASFKKSNKTYKLSVHTLPCNQEILIEGRVNTFGVDTILVYRNADRE
jgi:hypothetical protein